MCTPLIDGGARRPATHDSAMRQFLALGLRQNCHISIQARVALKPLVSLINRLVACSSRIRVDARTEQTDRQTHTETLKICCDHADIIFIYTWRSIPLDHLSRLAVVKTEVSPTTNSMYLTGRQKTISSYTKSSKMYKRTVKLQIV